jgi:hypothetical protein
MKTSTNIRSLTCFVILLLTVSNCIKAQFPFNGLCPPSLLSATDPSARIQWEVQNNPEQVKAAAANQAYQNKMNKYLTVMKKADIHITRTESELQQICFFRSQAHFYLDSARLVLRKAKNNISKEGIYIKKLDMYIVSTTSFIVKVDSDLVIANVYKDSAVKETKEAEALCLSLGSDDNTSHNQNILNYIVQLGAGELPLSYFSRVEGIKVIKPDDGIKRFVVGVFNTKEEAVSIKEKMVQMGYADAFIRTMDSLYK